MDKAIIIIAVSDYGGAYPSLPGALTSAQRMRDWATAGPPDRDYDVLYITDETGDVTVDRLRTEINAFLRQRFIERLVVYFAGHGLLRSTSERFWLLTNAARDIDEGVNVEAMRRRLVHFGFGNQRNGTAGQVCIISDTCQDVSRDAITFNGNGIVTIGPSLHPQLRADLDRFFAASPGQQAFQIDAKPPQPAYCLFSETLLNALEGNVPQVIERQWHPRKPAVISNLLCKYLEVEVPVIARSLGIQSRTIPDCTSQNHPPDNYYLLVQVPTPAGTPNRPLLPVGNAQLPMAVAQSTGNGANEFNTMLAARRRSIAAFQSKVDSIELRDPHIASRPLQEQKEWHRLRDLHHEQVAVCDFEPAEIYAPTGVIVDLQKLGDHTLVYANSLIGRPLLVRQGDRWIVLPHYPGVLSVLGADFPGDVMLKHKFEGYWDTTLSDFASSDPNTMLRVADARHVADEVREGKEAFPHRAVTAAYLYEFANDYDNILRTAHYLARAGLTTMHGPTVPFDVALLCADRLYWTQNERGTITAFADLPAVTEAQRSIDRPYYASVGFEALRAVMLWGIAPIYRAGWSFLEWNKTLEVPEQIRMICPHVAGRSATNLDAVGFEAFCTAFNYQRVNRNRREPDGRLFE